MYQKITDKLALSSALLILSSITSTGALLAGTPGQLSVANLAIQGVVAGVADFAGPGVSP